jgi:hypothetical protein
VVKEEKRTGRDFWGVFKFGDDAQVLFFYKKKSFAGCLSIELITLSSRFQLE